ncbi:MULTISPECIES: GntR family transcriptional regulator [unclassified Amycolatopsis]|uniref:GntR family transcriptional regulator n=1 Tax=unclassified Amycolatopsis TaxID=2618356 RepID=UPI0028770D9A|nr:MULTISPECIES: GntR family transcriptional regulator [unclassified Amycolatopsis]MDS0132114.1 GntR family transcriptional regulator [Amycolatopsis sp. 505]MDS0141148.1 GntR family transcriptional regulator [Amycolatopsis sp. CM201R]
MHPQVNPPSLAEQAYLFVRDRLVMLDIPPGSPLNEEELGTALGMGRTPIREALKRLESERLVVAYPRRGTFATDVNISDLAHISEVRRTLEPMATAAAAERATDADRAALTELRAQLDAGAPDRGNAELLRTDLALHRAIYRCVHNPFLEDTLIRYDNLATRIWCVFVPRLSGMAGHVDEHVPLLTAIIEGDAEKAAALTHAHVTGFEAAIRALI